MSIQIIVIEIKPAMFLLILYHKRCTLVAYTSGNIWLVLVAFIHILGVSLRFN